MSVLGNLERGILQINVINQLLIAVYWIIGNGKIYQLLRLKVIGLATIIFISYQFINYNVCCCGIEAKKFISEHRF